MKNVSFDYAAKQMRRLSEVIDNLFKKLDIAVEKSEFTQAQVYNDQVNYLLNEKEEFWLPIIERELDKYKLMLN